MEALLERTFEAEQRHFWFRGFKRFVAPLIEEATAGRSKPRLLDAGCGTGANLPFLAAVRRRRSASSCFWRGLQFGHARGLPRLTQGSVTHLPFADASIDVVLSFDVLYCLQAPDEQRRDRRDVQSAAARRRGRDQRCGARHAEGRSLGARRRSPPIHEAGAARKARARRISGAAPHLHERVAVPDHGDGARASAAARREGRRRRTRATSTCRPRPSTRCSRALLALESKLVAAGVNMPVGSSLLCLARSPTI